MSDIEESSCVFQQLIGLATGIPQQQIILANQGLSPPEGDRLYATYYPVPMRAYGQVRREREYSEPIEPYDPLLGAEWRDLTETAYTSVEVMLSVDFYHQGAVSAGLRLQNANFRLPVSAFLFQNKIAWRYVSDSRNSETLPQAEVQPDYRADIFLFIEVAESYAVLSAAGFNTNIIRS